MILYRTDYGEDYTRGELRVRCNDHTLMWLETIEPPWKDNEPFISCVPEGVYRVWPYQSGKFGPAYILENRRLEVGRYEGDAKRYGILIHPANAPSQLRGCIAPGLRATEMVIDGRKQKAVSDSRAAMDRLLRCLGRQQGRSLRIQTEKEWE